MRLVCLGVNVWTHPWIPIKSLAKRVERCPVDKGRYQRLVGKLIYLSHAKPDIAYSVNVVSQHISNPNDDHLEAVNKILRFLKMTPGHGLPFKKSGTRELEIYTNASWAG